MSRLHVEVTTYNKNILYYKVVDIIVKDMLNEYFLFGTNWYIFHSFASLKCFNSDNDVECLPKAFKRATNSCLVRAMLSLCWLNRIFRAVPIPVREFYSKTVLLTIITLTSNL